MIKANISVQIALISHKISVEKVKFDVNDISWTSTMFPELELDYKRTFYAVAKEAVSIDNFKLSTEYVVIGTKQFHTDGEMLVYKFSQPEYVIMDIN